MAENIIILQITSQMIFKLIFGTQIHIVKSNDKQKYMQFVKIIPNVFKHLPRRYQLTYLDEDGEEITFEDQSDYQVLLSSGLKTVKIYLRSLDQESIQHINQIQIDKAQQEIIQNQVSAIRQNSYKQLEQEASVQIPLFQESIIEEKIKKIMPEIISKIKSQISSELKGKQNAFLKKQIKQEKKNLFVQQKRQKNQEKPVTHEDIICDGCDQQGIIGIRYKCSVCPDFDFCQKCQATLEHNHPFLKIRTLKQTPVKIFALIQQQQIKKPWQGQNKSHENKSQSPSIDRLVHKGFDIVKGYFNGQSHEQLKEKCQAIKEQWKKKTNQWKNAWNEEKEGVKKEEVVINREQSKNIVEKKEETVVIVDKKQKVQANSAVIKQNASYLVSLLGFSLEKSLKLAQQFPTLTKEQLLNYCLSVPNLFE